ncbi:hypothetical protein TNCV_765241 [Trichonephila clavipes]|nr:hypothetical protein TNCV_765241 [Trichonephila clavipes]
MSQQEKKRQHINSLQSLNDVIHWSPSTIGELGHPVAPIGGEQVADACFNSCWIFSPEWKKDLEIVEDSLHFTWSRATLNASAAVLLYSERNLFYHFGFYGVRFQVALIPRFKKGKQELLLREFQQLLSFKNIEDYSNWDASLGTLSSSMLTTIYRQMYFNFDVPKGQSLCFLKFNTFLSKSAGSSSPYE